MTGQIPDVFRYEGEEYDLIGLKGSGLFEPQDIGIQPRPPHTACWRGYVREFDCVNNELILDVLHLHAEDTTPINNVEPVAGEHSFRFKYDNLHMKMTGFSGTILLAKDFIDSMYVHMGFQRPIAYRTVIELLVEQGNIIAVRDLSERMESLRLKDPSKGASPEDPSGTMEWIEKTFSLDYDSDI